MPDLARIDTFLSDLAKALLVSGAPVHDAERHISEVGKKLGLQTQCYALPTMISLAIDKPDGTQRIHMLRLPPADYNITRLIAIEALIAEFADVGSLDDTQARLTSIMTAPLAWGWRSLIVYGFILSAAATGLFNGGWAEMLGGAIVGVVFMIGYLLLSRRPNLAPVQPVILCALAAFVAQALCLVIPQQVVFISVLAGIILLLPGFTTTIGLGELATQHLIAGSGRLAGAFILMIMMGAGVAIGTSLGNAVLPTLSMRISPPLPHWAFWLSVAALGVSLIGVLQAPLRAAPIMVTACLMAQAMSLVATAQLGPVPGAFAAAFVVALVSHLYHRCTGRPALLLQVPGLITLVPGSVGFRGLNALMENNSLEGIKITTGMILTGTALAVGILLANGIAPALIAPRRQKPLSVNSVG